MKRIASIDVYRALTMLLMIWVNDFWTLQGVPEWLLHAEVHEDRLGFSDIIFPVFLLIVGMSIPFAIRKRREKGDSLKNIIKHILERTFALLLMGVLMVNYEYIPYDEGKLPKYLMAVIMITAFFLIFNDYKKEGVIVTRLKSLGWGLLILFVAFYPGSITSMHTHWWGILGLIGWAYGISALAYLWTGNNLPKIIGVTLFLLIFCIASFAGWLNFLEPVKKYVWISNNGALPFLTMLGVVSSVIYQNKTFKNFMTGMLILGLLLIAAGIALRPFWGINKILATPAWICITGGMAYITYALLYKLVDIEGREKIFSVLKPAGIATLTCYLIPYYWYAFSSFTGWAAPEFLTIYPIGLVKSMASSFIIILVTGWLLKRGVKLKI